MFLLNVPVAVGALVLCARFVQDLPRAGKAELDWIGALLATSGLAGLTWALTLASGPTGWAGLAATGLAAGGLLLVVFVLFEKHRGPGAMMPLDLFKSKVFVGLSLVTFMLYGGLGGLLVLLPYVLIDLKNYSATAAGAALLPMPLVIALTASTMGKLAAKVGPRLPLAIGSAVVAIGFLLAMRISVDESYWAATLPAMLVISLGMAGAVAPLTTAVLGSVDAKHSGIASGFNSAVARTGGLIATAMASAILVAHAQDLESAFRTAMVACAAAAAAASVCAFLWLAHTDPDRTALPRN
jgi:predicted MFS family arabinose efflux permease